MNCSKCGQKNREGATFCDSCGAGLLADSQEMPSSQRQSDAPNSFVGRQRELEQLNTALNEVLSGRGRLLMLVGEPGIGKTRLAQEMAFHAGALGAQVLWGRCYEEEGTPPYWPWLQLLRSYIQQQTPNQLQSEMGSGAADISETPPNFEQSCPIWKRRQPWSQSKPASASSHPSPIF